MFQETVLLCESSWVVRLALVADLSVLYAKRCWASTWKELLAVRDADGQVLRQYGTVDEFGKVFPETAELLARQGMSSDDAGWPDRLWQLADEGALRDHDGATIVPYWSLDQSQAELHTFVKPAEQGGYGGEILVVLRDGKIVGFTAYACARGDTGRAVAHKRFPVERLHIPIDNPSPSLLSVKGLLEARYPGDLAFGIFLDHAVSESERGNGFGSLLFDARLDRLVELGADVIFGRTMVTAPRQYAGNYLARGLKPIAADGTDEFSRQKHYFVAERADLRVRPKK